MRSHRPNWTTCSGSDAWHACATGRAAIVIDDVVQPPWQPRGVTIRGRAEAITDDRGARIRIHPDRVVAWGLE